jgi:hypothetical protein
MPAAFFWGHHTMIVRDHRGKYYRVFDITGASDAPDCAMSHMWHGFELHYVKCGIFRESLTRAGKRRWTYVCKAKATVVEGAS